MTTEQLCLGLLIVLFAVLGTAWAAQRGNPWW